MLFSFPNFRTLLLLSIFCTISSFCSLEYCLLFILHYHYSPFFFLLVILLYNKSYFSVSVSSGRGVVHTTFIKLLNKRKKRKDKYSLDVKLGIGKTFKEDRCLTGKSKRLKSRLVFAGVGKIGRGFMEELSLLAEKNFPYPSRKCFLRGRWR